MAPFLSPSQCSISSPITPPEKYSTPCFVSSSLSLCLSVLSSPVFSSFFFCHRTANTLASTNPQTSVASHLCPDLLGPHIIYLYHTVIISCISKAHPTYAFVPCPSLHKIGSCTFHQFDLILCTSIKALQSRAMEIQWIFLNWAKWSHTVRQKKHRWSFNQRHKAQERQHMNQ